MDEQNVTKAEHVPPHETTASPVDVNVAMPRYFGITPPTLLFGIASATLAVAIVLAVLAHWVAALVLAASVLVEIAIFLGVASRKPDTAVARASADRPPRARTGDAGSSRRRPCAPRRGAGSRRFAASCSS